jgi:hypothetical protein
MLMDIKCSADPQIEIRLKFDNQENKSVTVGRNDLVDIEYNKNGVRKRIEGIVTKVSTNGTESLGWCIIVDGSGDFSSEIARISPKNILDIDIIRKAEAVQGINSPKDKSGIMSLRVKGGRLQYSQNGYDWYPVIIDRENVIVPGDDKDIDPGRPHHHPKRKDDEHGIKPDEGGWDDGEIPDISNDDGIVTDNSSSNFGNDELLDEVY